MISAGTRGLRFPCLPYVISGPDDSSIIGSKAHDPQSSDLVTPPLLPAANSAIDGAFEAMVG